VYCFTYISSTLYKYTCIYRATFATVLFMYN
jgi:hypothetical protein